MSKKQTALIDELNRECFDLVARCVELIGKIGWDANDTYTFDDGIIWNKFDPMNEEGNNEQ